MRNSYLYGMNVLGADPVYYGPESPADLANADRILTPAEQAAVDEWQSKEADAMAVAEEKKGGPKAQVVEVTPKGAVISAPQAKPKAPPVGRPYYAPLSQPTQAPVLKAIKSGTSPWLIVGAILGGTVILIGAYAVIRS